MRKISPETINRLRELISCEEGFRKEGNLKVKEINVPNRVEGIDVPRISEKFFVILQPGPKPSIFVLRDCNTAGRFDDSRHETDDLIIFWDPTLIPEERYRQIL